MNCRTTLIRLGVAAVICLGILVTLNHSFAQNAQQVQAKDQAGLQQVPQIQIAQPPNGQPFPIAPGQFQPPNGPPVQIAPGLPNGKFNGPIPNAGAPVEYKTKEGKKGWKVVIPGNRPLATPAVVDGKVLIGGGFGSYEFYSLDAKTGKQNWVYRTGDDGPTAAVISDGYIAFNTESCEIEIITMEGKQIWKKWLGDPLMSMPAISQGKVYQSYPANGKHMIACFALKNGEQFWTKEIPGQVVTAPIISKGKLYVTTLEGSMTCMETRDGAVVWQEKKNATSAPVVFNGEVFFSRRAAVKIKDQGGKEVAQQMEAIAGKGAAKDAPVANLPGTEQKADYLDLGKRIQGSPLQQSYSKQDASVGFGTAPTGAGLGGAGMNLGQNTVNGIWAYQGSKPFIYNNLLYSCMGDSVKCVDPQTQKVKWQKDLKNADNKKPLVDAALTPPAIVNGKMFMGTSAGQIVCMSAESGKVLWTATVEGSISFQPAVANGMVYVSTNNGAIYAIETGDARDHGWLMWGANAEHNGGID
jgi:outer membrane protein assembly factor BamB